MGDQKAFIAGLLEGQKWGRLQNSSWEEKFSEEAIFEVHVKTVDANGTKKQEKGSAGQRVGPRFVQKSPTLG